MEQDNSGIERGDEMIEANHVFDLKTAAEWNEHGNTHLKAGAYNDAIVAYTKAIELAPDASWPYIQNLAHVHYQKGKARGKLTVGKIEDPDLWEGDDESDSASLFGYDAITNSEGSDASEEPGLEKQNRNSSIGQSPASTDTGKGSSNITDPVECCASNKDKTVLEPKEEASNVLTENSIAKVEESQELETGVNIPSKNPITPQFVENTPRNSIDWNELGNSYTSSKKFDDAIEAYKKAIEMNPKYGQPFSNLGFIYYRLGKYEIAILLYKKSIDLLDTPEDKAVSWNKLGDAYRRLGDYGNASAAYQKSSEMAPAMSPVMARARATLLENVVAG
jgi:tetratricopeptide (TPR) repeat protein